MRGTRDSSYNLLRNRNSQIPQKPEGSVIFTIAEAYQNKQQIMSQSSINDQKGSGFMVEKMIINLTHDFITLVKGKKIKVKAILNKIKIFSQEKQICQDFIEWEQIFIPQETVIKENNEIRFEFVIDKDVKARYITPPFPQTFKKNNEIIKDLSDIQCAKLQIEISWRGKQQFSEEVKSFTRQKSNRVFRRQEEENFSFWNCFGLRPSYEMRVKEQLKVQKTVVYTLKDFSEEDINQWSQQQSSTLKTFSNDIAFHYNKENI